MSEQKVVDPNELVKMELPVGVVQSILNLLGKGQYAEVAGIITLIQTQVGPQVDALAADKEPETPPEE